MGPTCSHRVFLRERQREVSQGHTEDKTRGRQRQSLEGCSTSQATLRMPAATEAGSSKEGKLRISQSLWKEYSPDDTLTLDFRPLELGKSKFLPS